MLVCIYSESLVYLNRHVNNSGYTNLAVTMVPIFVNEIKIVTKKKSLLNLRNTYCRVGRINYSARIITFGFSGSVHV